MSKMSENEKLTMSYYSECSDTGLIGKTIGEYFAEITEKYPNNDALVCRHERDANGEILRYTYKEFYEVCRQAAKGFMKLGVQKGDMVYKQFSVGNNTICYSIDWCYPREHQSRL
jgi:non-ribosomal peptide synthetase component E (peptide arylation enzyme)